jgi:hypothetical protein
VSLLTLDAAKTALSYSARLAESGACAGLVDLDLIEGFAMGSLLRAQPPR